MIVSRWAKVSLDGSLTLTKRRPMLRLGEWGFEIRVSIPSATTRFLSPVEVTIQDATVSPSAAAGEPEAGTEQPEDEGESA